MPTSTGRERTARLRRLDDVLGGGDTYRVYLGEVQYTKSLLRSGSFTNHSRRRLTALLAEQAQQAGWARRAATSRATHRTPISTATAWPSSPTNTITDDRRTAVELADD
jgi:hypothetical protein